MNVLGAMGGLNGTGLSEGLYHHVLMIGLAAFVAIGLPNVQEIMGRFSPAVERLRPYRGWLARPLLWRPNMRWATGISLVIVLVLVKLAFDIYRGLEPNEYIYFQF